MGRIILTATLVVGAILGFVLDWSGNHLLNPLWHPHARFHGALLLFFLAGVSGTGVWLLWRDSKEPEVALKAASLLSLSFWTPFFYISALLPSSTPWAGPPNQIPRVAGNAVYPNILVAGLFAVITLTGYRLAKRQLTSAERVRNTATGGD